MPELAVLLRHATSTRFLESADEYFPYHVDVNDPRPQGRWNISGHDLPDDVL